MNAPINTAMKSSIAISGINRSQISKNTALTANIVQNTFLLFDGDIMCASGSNTNNDICIDTKHSINRAAPNDIPLSPDALTMIGKNNKDNIDKIFAFFKILTSYFYSLIFNKSIA